MNIFLDLDLLILGMEREQYVKYAKNIRKEYDFVPDDIYAKERKIILNQYLNSQFIFKTKNFRDLFEKQARNNIKFEIDNILSKQ
jgi:predicted metal-dependent HD superfamily phosphohydrolase